MKSFLARGTGLFLLAALFSGFGGGRLAAQNAPTIQLTVEFQQSRQALAQSNYDGAITALQPLLSQPVFVAETQVEIGNIRLRQAEAEMSTALNHFNEAASYFQQGVDQGNIKSLEVPKVLYELGRIYEERMNDPVRAAEVYSRIIQDHPTSLSIDKITFHLASCLEKTGKVADAANYYREIVAKYPYSSFFQLAQSRMKTLAPGTGQAGAAIETQESLVDSAKDEAQSSKANMDLAAMYTKNGNYKQAVETYRKAAAEAPTPEAAREALKRIATLLDEKEKDYKGAAAVLEEIVTKYPGEPGTDQNLYKLGRIYEQNLDSLKTQIVDGRVRYRRDDENANKALEYYDKVTENYPDADVSADAYLRKAEIYDKKLKDSESAKREYREFLKRFPDHPEVERISERLKTIDEENE